MLGLRRDHITGHEAHRGSPKQDVRANKRDRRKEGAKVEGICEGSKDGGALANQPDRAWFSSKR